MWSYFGVDEFFFEIDETVAVGCYPREWPTVFDTVLGSEPGINRSRFVVEIFAVGAVGGDFALDARGFFVSQGE